MPQCGANIWNLRVLNLSTYSRLHFIVMATGQPLEKNGREATLDDQRLFLKVLEDLKNAVTKPDAEALKREALNDGNHSNQKIDLISESDCASEESQNVCGMAEKSDAEEPGTTTVTVSDTTKSRILQKLQVGNEKSDTDDVHEQTVLPQSINLSQASVVYVSGDALTNPLKSVTSVSGPENIVLAIMNMNKINESLAGKNMVTVKAVNKDSIHESLHAAQVTAPILAKPTSVQLFSCEYCDYYSDNKRYLKQHMDFVHNSDRPFKCPYCDYAGKRSHALREHLIVHTDSRPFQCQVCNATFRKKGHLTNHVKLHNSKRLVKCPLCKALVYDTGENGLDVHLKTDHDTERLYGCDLCDYVAAKEPEILQHLKQKHRSKLMIYKCDKCPFQSADNTAFQHHTKAHDLSDQKVQIGSNVPTSVIGVAAVPAGDTQPGAVSAMIKLVGAGSSSEAPATSQPSMVNPLWIKCSECGFVAHDSEVVKKHMLDHLKEQFGEDYDQHLGQSDSQGSAAKSESSRSSTGSETPTQTSPVKAPILVPVTNVDQLLPKNIGKIDMNSPILVPVTDPHLLQRLKSATTQSTTAVKLATTTKSATTTAMSVSMSLPQAQSVIATGVSKTPFLLEQGFKAPNLRVIPIAHSSAGPIPTITALPISLIPSQNQPGHGTVQTCATPSLAVSVSTTGSSYELGKVMNATLMKSQETRNEPNEGNVITEKSTTSKPDDKINSLIANLSNVHKVIAYQEKVSSKLGDSSEKQVLHEKLPENRIVYYLDTFEKKNSTVKESQGFVHDSNAGRFRCTICGYTCEYQRTIKAHIWKHSGNKNVDYPMFRNGPLSVYEDEPLTVCSIENQVDSAKTSTPISINNALSHETPFSSASLPSVIVYEQPRMIVSEATSTSSMVTKVFRNQPNETVTKPYNILLAKHTLPESNTGMTKRAPVFSTMTTADESNRVNTSKTQTVMMGIDSNDALDDSLEREDCLTIDETETGLMTSMPVQQNVVVETVDSFSESYTAMESQQNSPRLNTRSPDSGLSEMTAFTSQSQSLSASSRILSPNSHGDMTSEDTSENCSFPEVLGLTKRSRSVDSSMDESLSPKKLRIADDHEDSAVTLLSLLKKGPNFNPACPPSQQKAQVNIQSYSGTSSPGYEDSSSVGEVDMGSGKRKPSSGISTSLLAVIEQLRERSKSDLEEEKPVQPAAKKQYKRRSRKSSMEDNAPASGIENVEEFVKGGEVKYRCKLCHYTNESTLLLRQHMKLHKPKQQFECSLCDLIAESSEALQDHMIQHCKIRTYQCKLCSFMFNYKSQLRAHMRMHNDQDILMCDYCDFETRNPAAFKIHTKGHFSKPPYKCSECYDEFVSSSLLKTHKREGCSDKNTNIVRKCDECDFTCVGRRELKNHQRIHMGKAVVQVPKRCSYCDHTEATIEQIRKHITDVHGESKPLKCDMCGFVAVSIRSLKSHMKRHVNDQRFVAQPLEQYKCNLCGYVCHHLPSLKSHMWRHAADLHYSYEFTNDVINAAIDFDYMKGVTETNQEHVEQFRNLIVEKMKAKGLDMTGESVDESAKACCWVTFRCCQCGFETINKAELNLHMGIHTDVIKMTLEVGDDAGSSRQSQDEDADDNE
ncbi:uncharacterized protein LOC128243071 [Mya arenaria]|uniref:uncharacterized protein LOC128243071 n=1 Tax=Mya arenaria TaxID=6604 RepID=UPI0022E0BEEA|nr:uncharacterized protein LOC128243071 [Mya arenaria]